MKRYYALRRLVHVVHVPAALFNVSRNLRIKPRTPRLMSYLNRTPRELRGLRIEGRKCAFAAIDSENGDRAC